jgi:hypothetical protein
MWILRGCVPVAIAGGLAVATGCSSNSAGAGDTDAQSAMTVACPGACVYQTNLDDTCGSGPQPSPNGWTTVCMDLDCANVSSDPMGSADPVSGCVTSLVHRGWQRFGGTCDDWNRLGLELPEAGGEPEGIACQSASDCASGTCVGIEPFDLFCANDCPDGGGCSAGFACKQGSCVPRCLQ